MTSKKKIAFTKGITMEVIMIASFVILILVLGTNNMLR